MQRCRKDVGVIASGATLQRSSVDLPSTTRHKQIEAKHDDRL